MECNNSAYSADIPRFYRKPPRIFREESKNSALFISLLYKNRRQQEYI